MKKIILNLEIRKDKRNKRGFAFFPTIAIEAHPTHHRWHLIWWEVYEIDMGRKWIIENPLGK